MRENETATGDAVPVSGERRSGPGAARRSVTEPPLRPSLARRMWPMLSLAAVLGALALLRMAWIHKDNQRGTSSSPVAAGRALDLPSAPARPQGIGGEAEREPTAPRPPADAQSKIAPRPSTVVTVPSKVPSSPPPRHRGAGMPIPALPHF